MLGEALIAAGKITRPQLDEAIQSQAVFGGKLGTNLIELGYLDLRTLTAMLAEKHRLPSVDSFAAAQIPASVLNALPRSIVEKFRVVPVALKGRRLTVLMMDPGDLRLMDELQFASGYIVTPCVAPELTVLTLLERHYGIKRDLRYITLSRVDQAALHNRPAPAPRHVLSHDLTDEESH